MGIEEFYELCMTFGLRTAVSKAVSGIGMDDQDQWVKKKQQPTWHMKMLGCWVHAGSGVELTVTGRTPATISACSQPKTNQKAEHECSLDTPISHDPKHKPASMLTNDGYESTEPKFVLIFEHRDDSSSLLGLLRTPHTRQDLDYIRDGFCDRTDCVVKCVMKIV